MLKQFLEIFRKMNNESDSNLSGKYRKILKIASFVHKSEVR